MYYKTANYVVAGIKISNIWKPYQLFVVLLTHIQDSRILIIDKDLINYADKPVLCQSTHFYIQLLYNESLQQPKM